MTDELKVQLLTQLDRPEDPWVERKESFDERDVRKTLVGFANSVREGEMAVLFLGARNNGQHPGLGDADDCQKKVAGAAKKCYPPITYQPGILEVNVAGASRVVLAVMVPFSKDRPHFAGPAYIRRGSETLEASREVFADLIASQNEKARKILQFKGYSVRLRFRSESGFFYEVDGRVDHCDAHTVSIRDNETYVWSFAIPEVEIYHEGGLRLVITVRPVWTEEDHVRHIVQRWAAEQRERLHGVGIDPQHYLVRQLLANPQKTGAAVAAAADGTTEPALKWLLAFMRFELKKLTNPLTREQKLEYFKKSVRKASSRRVLLNLDLVYTAQVNAVADVATSLDEARELLAEAGSKDKEVQTRQWNQLMIALGIPVTKASER